MSQSAIWDALLIAGDALQDGRLDDCEGVLGEIDAMGAWDFEFRRPRVTSLASLEAVLKRAYPAHSLTALAARSSSYGLSSGRALGGMNFVVDPNCPPNRVFMIGGDVSINPQTLATLELGES